MGNEQSQAQQQQEQPEEIEEKVKRTGIRKNQQSPESGEEFPNERGSSREREDQYSVADDDAVPNTVQKPIQSQPSFRQNPMNLKESNNQFKQNGETAQFGENPNNYQEQDENGEQPINSFRGQESGRYDQQQFQQNYQQQQYSSNPSSQNYGIKPNLQSFQQNQQGLYEDPNAAKFTALDQARKNQIISEQLGTTTTKPFNKERKLTKAEEEDLVYNLVQKGKDIEYRNRVLQEKFKNQESSECNFQPSSVVLKLQNDKKSTPNQSQQIGQSLAQQRQSKRSLEEFLNDQNKFMNKRDRGLKEVKSRVEEKQMEGFTGKPQLCQKSENMVNKKKEQNQAKTKKPAYKRLYELNEEKRQKVKEEQREKLYENNENKNEKLFNQSTMQSVGGGQKSRIKEEAANRLYQDFRRRQEKQKDQEQYFSKKLNTQEPSQQYAQKKNDLCLAKKLLKEFDVGIANLQNEYNKNLQYLDYIQMSELLKELHFTTEHIRVESSNFIKERSLINDLWIILEGQNSDIITGRNLILVMLGIMGIHIDIPTFKPDQEQMLKKPIQQLPQQQEQKPIQNRQQIDSAIPLNRDSDLYDEQQEIMRKSHLNQLKLKEQHDIQQNAENQLRQSNGSHQSSRMSHVQSSCELPKQNEYQDALREYQPIDLSDKKQHDFNNMRQFYNQRYDQLIVGSYDSDRNLILTEEDVKKIQRHFHVLYLNRLNYVDKTPKVDKNKKEDDVLSQQQSMMSQKNDVLAQNYRQKLYDIAKANQNGQEPLTNYDLMLAHKDIRNRNAAMMKEIKEEKEMEECTFAPITKQYNSVYSEEDTCNNNNSNEPNWQKDSKQLKNYKRPITSQSLGANRYLSLYKLAKPRSQLRDKATDEVEYEKNCDECTFNPDLHSIKQPKAEGKNFTYVKDGDKTVNRIRTAHDTNEDVRVFKDRGYDYYQKPESTTLGSKKLSKSQQNPIPQRYNNINNNNNNNFYNSPLPEQNENIEKVKRQPKQPEYSFGKPDLYSQDSANQNKNYDPYHQQQQQQQQQPQQQCQEYSDGCQVDPEEQDCDDCCDENYDQVNDLNQCPSNNEEEDIPTLFVDVNLSPERVERIVVKKGDNIEEKADQFIQQHQLDPSIKGTLISLLNQQISQFLEGGEQ